ncbi:protein eva-1 homolog C isoform X3 [Pezoporus wallicus]|uniref:protein eva-1 homolog C isoform X3 n=1 Tax=Pezoporus wallicus TaxID=35540 RepID=UPI00254BE00C|nr:protein eva-1 homolog C isoform X3 [Pezoporus wallicus]XP_061309689.1 protein eva-1 homolog C isoform X3 [Pezoporus flaviventris]
MRDGDAGQHPRRRQVEPGRLLPLLSCVILVCSAEVAALADFSGYLTKLLQNHTAYACDGEHLSLHCPRHSTISVQSAFYGQDYHMCSTQETETRITEPINCVAPTSLQKVLDECQNLRSCQLLVNSRVFGPDLCPGTTKFLLVSFKCKPTEYKTKSACENQELKLHCQESKFLIIYSATYGRWAHEENICSTEVERVPPFVPKFILTAFNPLVTNNRSSVKQNDGVDLDPKESRLPKKDGIIFSNYLATFAYIRDHLERAALLFLSSVCVGLIFTLCALVIRTSCSRDFQKLHRKKDPLMPESTRVHGNSENEEEEEEEEGSSDSDIQDGIVELYRPSYSGYNSTEAAELAERIERREQIIQEIWMNSGLDMTPPRNMDTFYIHEQ